MIKHITKPLIATALLGFAQFASAIPVTSLQDLFDGASLTSSNGIEFSNFNDQNGFANASLIEVMAGPSGLTFTATQGVLSLESLTGDSDRTMLWFDYTATAASGSTIDGQSMSAEMGHSPCSNDAICGNAEFGYTLIWKEILDATRNSLADIIFVEGNEANVFNSYGIAPTGNSASAAGTSLIIDDYIEIEISEFEAGNVSSWTQSFTQSAIPAPGPEPVPAPATLALFALGLLGLGFSRRKA